VVGRSRIDADDGVVRAEPLERPGPLTRVAQTRWQLLRRAGRLKAKAWVARDLQGGRGAACGLQETQCVRSAHSGPPAAVDGSADGVGKPLVLPKREPAGSHQELVKMLLGKLSPVRRRADFGFDPPGPESFSHVVDKEVAAKIVAKVAVADPAHVEDAHRSLPLHQTYLSTAARNSRTRTRVVWRSITISWPL